jgi:hypothetical protein
VENAVLLPAASVIRRMKNKSAVGFFPAKPMDDQYVLAPEVEGVFKDLSQFTNNDIA